MDEVVLDIDRIIEILPHGYPFLLVDRVVELEPGERGVCLKNVTMNEPQFMGHFPGKPIMPGVLIVEAMAQTAAITVIESFGKDLAGKLVYFMSIDKARFRQKVTPGDTMYIEVQKTQSRGAVWKFDCEAKVNGKKVAEASISAMIADNE